MFHIYIFCWFKIFLHSACVTLTYHLNFILFILVYKCVERWTCWFQFFVPHISFHSSWRGSKHSYASEATSSALWLHGRMWLSRFTQEVSSSFSSYLSCLDPLQLLSTAIQTGCLAAGNCKFTNRTGMCILMYVIECQCVHVINPRCTCTARVTVLAVSVCLSVYLCVCVCLSVTTLAVAWPNSTLKLRYD